LAGDFMIGEELAPDDAKDEVARQTVCETKTRGGLISQAYQA
jgi:hypothetical protein